MKRPAPKEILAFILARGGSTGVPRKNIRRVGGKPLIVRTIEVARASRFINRTIVATDDREIAAVSRSAGADVPFERPEELSRTLSRAYDVYRFFLEKLRERENYRPDIFVMLFATSYAKRVEEVDAAIEKLITTNADWVFTVCECEHHPYRVFEPVPGTPDQIRPYCAGVPSYDLWGNRQELPPAYRINGNAFVTWTENIENFTTYNIDRVRYADTDIRYVLCPQETSMDIDTQIDFSIADFLLSSRDFFVGTHAPSTVKNGARKGREE